jgi:hypothetical protein
VVDIVLWVGADVYNRSLCCVMYRTWHKQSYVLGSGDGCCGYYCRCVDVWMLSNWHHSGVVGSSYIYTIQQRYDLLHSSCGMGTYTCTSSMVIDHRNLLQDPAMYEVRRSSQEGATN